VGAGGAVDRSHDADRVGAFQRQGHERRRRDEVDEAAEERLLPMGGVVLLGEAALDVHELHPDELESALLVPGEDAAGQLALDAVGLHEDEGSFAHAGSPSCGESPPGSAASGGLG
jgi:hypothetical protein